MEVIKGMIVHALANHLTPEFDLGNSVEIRVALSNGLVKEAIHHINLATGNQRQRYEGELVDLMFDYIEGRIGNETGIKIGYTGKTLTRMNLTEALDELREIHLREKRI